MSIATELNRLIQAKEDIASAIEAKGVTVPSSTTIDGYANLVSQISGGGGITPSGTITISENGTYDVSQYANAVVNVSGSSTSYVADGLILHLMGEDAEANRWVDRVGGYEYTLENCTLGTNYVHFNGSSSIGYCSNGPSGNITAQTVEAVFYLDSAPTGNMMLFGFPPSASGIIGQTLAFQNNGWSVRAYAYGNTAVTSVPNIAVPTSGQIITYSNYGRNASIVNGSASATSTSGGSFYSTGAVASVGGRKQSAGSLFFAGRLYQLRLYSRVLTTKEIYTNYIRDVDKYSL